jgi:hypothetical protein
MLKNPPKPGEEGEKSKFASKQADKEAGSDGMLSAVKSKDLANILKLALGLGEETVKEGFSTEGEATLAKIAAAGDDGYEMIEDGINGLLGTEAQIMLQDMYDDISIEHRLHPDDDFEKIYDRMMDRIEKDYGDSDADTFEGLDANQKRAGQLGPTEKVGPKGAVGKLVGASESIERDPLDDLKRLLGN